MFRVINFINHQDEGFIDFAKALCQILIHRIDPGLAIHHEQDHLSCGDRDIDFGVDLFRKTCIHSTPDPACIDDCKRDFPEFAFGRESVARDARLIVDD